jgi:FAD/FMN-containing dehydrogenase
MGVVTWASLKCELAPKRKKAFFVAEDNPEALFAFTYQLLTKGYGDELFLLNNTQLAALMKGTGIQPEFEEARKALPSWVLLFCFAAGEWFPEEQMEYLERDLKEMAQQCGVSLENRVGSASAAHVLSLLEKGHTGPYWKSCVTGGFTEIFFVSTLDRTPRFIEGMVRMADEAGVPDTRVGVYLQPLVQGTSCHCEFDIYFAPGQERETSSARKLFERASTGLMEQGAFFSRPYPAWADKVFASRSEFAKALRNVKSVFDPNQIMNPGKLCF